MLHCWAPILDVQRCEHSFQTLEGLDQLYETKRPTAKKIKKLFRGKPSTGGERQSLDYLKKFVNSLEGKALSICFYAFAHGVMWSPVTPQEFVSLHLKGSRDTLWLVHVLPSWSFLRYTNLSQLLLKSLQISWRKAKRRHLTRFNNVSPIFVPKVQYFSIADMVVKRCIMNHANN